MPQAPTALIIILAVYAASVIQGAPQTPGPASVQGKVKALVGGTLIDGYGGRPVRNSVVLIEGERITAVGVQGSLADARGC